MSQRILAIDDSHTLRQFILRNLSQMSPDFEVSVAKDGAEGLALAEKIRPNLILLDFILPDMRGDEVCRRLLQNPLTKSLPVILMSSNASDIKRVESQFSNVLKSIAKPFTAEVLSATVTYALRETAPTQGSGSTSGTQRIARPGAVIPSDRQSRLVGDTGFFPLNSILNALSNDSVTGTLLFHTQPRSIELLVAHGVPLLATTRDAEAYLRGTTHSFTIQQIKVLDEAARLQEETGCPTFLTMSQQGLLARSAAITASRKHGFKLFSRVWTEARLPFEFQESTTLPEYAALFETKSGSMDEFAMETLRCIGEESLSAVAWGDASGIPAYTRKGYERIQQIPLNPDEIRFATEVSRGVSLGEIADSLGMTLDQAQEVLFRFLCLEIFDYWPASALRG